MRYGKNVLMNVILSEEIRQASGNATTFHTIKSHIRALNSRISNLISEKRQPGKNMEKIRLSAKLANSFKWIENVQKLETKDGDPIGAQSLAF